MTDITVLYPCDRNKVWLTCDWPCHLRRPGYNRAYAGTDYAGSEQPLWASQYQGKVLQSMWSTQGYGYTTFVEYCDIDGNPALRVRNAHQKTLAVSVGDIVQPGQWLGIMDSTGNSTGTHTHFEVWLRINGVWQNVDPLDAKYGVKLVNNINQLVPIGGVPEPPPPPPGWSIPEVDFVYCKNIQDFRINLREKPFVSTSVRVLSMVEPGQIWEFCGHKVDTLGNVWFALRKGDRVGWAASLYNGEPWIVPVDA